MIHRCLFLYDGNEHKRVHLDRAYYGLQITEMIWGELEKFPSDGICLVLASLPYDENDEIRDYDTFLREKQTYENSIS